MNNYHSLTPQQQTQVAYLFADVHFGKDPSAYLYELRGETVTGRKPITTEARKKNKSVQTIYITRGRTSSPTNRNMDAARDALASVITRTLQEQVNA